MRRTWLSDVIGTEKAAIGVVHFKAFPSDPLYDAGGGMENIVECARKDLLAMEKGGIDAVLFSNEFSFPYENHPSREVLAGMAYVIGRLKDDIHVPFGANVISDAHASISLNAAVGGTFMRGTLSGAYSANTGIQDVHAGEFHRHRYNLRLENNLKMVQYVVPESSGELGGRDKMTIARSTVFEDKPDALGFCGESAGRPIDLDFMRECRRMWPDMVLFATTGVKLETIEQIYSVADAAFVATYFKRDGVFENEVDENRVRAFMEKLNDFRRQIQD